jgi:DNA mismatch repair protein MutS
MLDEIGRGTATLDGLSIAWAVIEHLHNKIGCRTLFATHFHELVELANDLKKLKCYHMAVAEMETNPIFVHKVIAGPTHSSFGIQVAKLAGLPSEVLIRAAVLLQQLETKKSTSLSKVPTNVEVKAKSDSKSTKALEEISKIISAKELDDITGREALDIVHAVKNKIKKLKDEE